MNLQQYLVPTLVRNVYNVDWKRVSQSVIMINRIQKCLKR